MTTKLASILNIIADKSMQFFYNSSNDSVIHAQDIMKILPVIKKHNQVIKLYCFFMKTRGK